MFWDGLMEPTVSINFTKVLQPDFVANFSNCYTDDCHAIVGRFVEITTTFPLDGAIVKVRRFQYNVKVHQTLLPLVFKYITEKCDMFLLSAALSNHSVHHCITQWRIDYSR